MRTQNRFATFPYLLAVFTALILATACAPTPPPTLFIAPWSATATRPPITDDTPVPPTSTPRPVATPNPTATPPCTDSLKFLEDISIPDATVISPGASVDKQWLVENDGTCNWDSRYRLRFAGGLDMGAEDEQALYPARAGEQVTLRILFTAPNEPGTYSTAWQAINPDGEAFGVPVFMEINVQAQAELTVEIIDGGQ